MDSLCCPLTKKQFQDPVIGADGYTYERYAIIEWLRKNETSPLTREPMDVRSLKKNHAITTIINELSTISKFSLSHQQFQLNKDIRMKTKTPLFKSSEKVIYELEWMTRQGPPIVLLEIKGPEAIRETSFYVYLSCHLHIIRTFGFVKSDSKSTCLVQEYARAGDLAELLREHRFRPSEDVLVEIFAQICDAMICLAANGIVHGDLACRNVLVFRSNAMEPEENFIKLTDFGLTRGYTIYSVDDNTTSSTTIVVPIRYAAPEILQTMDTRNYSEKSDIYSMGVLMWEALSLATIPYSSIESDHEVRHRKLRKEKLPQPSCSRDLWNIMNKCWCQRPEDRPDFRSLKQSLLMLQLRNLSNRKKESIDNEISNPLRSIIIDDNFTTTRIAFHSINRDQVNSCSFCRKSFTTAEEFSTHLTTCGNKTELCRNCNRFVRRAIFVYHQDHNCTDPEESSEQITRPNLEASTLTRMPPSNINDDSAFVNRRNTTQFASMRTNPKSSRSTVECEYCHVHYEITEYEKHQENCIRRVFQSPDPTHRRTRFDRPKSMSPFT